MHLIQKGYRELLWCGGLELENPEPHFSIEQRYARVKRAAGLALKDLSINWSLWRRELKEWPEVFETELQEVKKNKPKSLLLKPNVLVEGTSC